MTLIIQPDLPEFLSSAISISATNAMRVFGNDYLPDAVLIAGTRGDWYRGVYCGLRFDEDLKSRCLNGEFGGPGGGSGWPTEYEEIDAYGAVYGPLVKINASGPVAEAIQSPAYIFLSSFANKSKMSSSVLSAPAHELFHVLQGYKFAGGRTTAESAKKGIQTVPSKDCQNRLDQCPSIWVEGSAFYFGNAVANISNPGLIDERGMPVKPGWITQSRYGLDEALNWTVNDMLRSSKIADYAYFAGGVMTELLVAQFGLERVLDLTSNSSRGYSDIDFTFKKNFELTFGVTWESWRPTADKYIFDFLDGNVSAAKEYLIAAPANQ